MTLRPADIPVEVWRDTREGRMERVNRNCGRIFVTTVPKAYRRQLKPIADLGPIPMLIVTGIGHMLRVYDWASQRFNRN